MTKSILTKVFNFLPISIMLIVIGAFIIGAPAKAGWVNTAADSFNAFSPVFGVSAGSKPVDPRLYIANIIKVVLGFLGFIAVVMIIYAGFTWMTSRGQKEKVEGAQKTMTAAVIGLLIVLISLSITVFITNAIIGSTMTPGLNQVPILQNKR